MNKQQDELRNSSYDGIQEYDNDLPRWWLYLFYFTIVWGLGYAGYMFIGGGTTTEQDLAVAMSALKTQQAAAQAKSAASDITESELLALSKSPESLASGKAVFVARCMACHGMNGEGLVGPNLTDKYWIHGGRIVDIRHTVQDGVTDKGMLAWKNILSKDELNSVVGYIWSIQGSNPANPKAPQGDLVE